MTFCATCTSAPVLGLRPLRAPRILAEKTPKPRSSNSIPASQSFDDFVNYRVDDVLYVPLVKVRILRSDALYQFGFYHAQTWIRGWQIGQMSVKQAFVRFPMPSHSLLTSPALRSHPRRARSLCCDHSAAPLAPSATDPATTHPLTHQIKKETAQLAAIALQVLGFSYA